LLIKILFNVIFKDLNSEKRRDLVVVAGPTAVGKTDLCVRLAKKYQTVVVSADSRQFYKEMSIGTAKPTLEERDNVIHFFVDNISVDDEMNAGRYEIEALSLLENLFFKHEIIILTGGSGLYIKAVCEGFDDLPEVDPEIRNQLNKRLDEIGLQELAKELVTKDPDYAQNVDLKNPQRVIRALEVIKGTGIPFSIFRKGTIKQRNFNIIKVGLERNREELYKRIDMRMDLMIGAGLFEEAENLIPYRNHNALQTVGYKEIYDYLDGKYEIEEAIRLLKRNTRRYAKRQLTWFKKDNMFKWFHPSREDEIIKYIEQNRKV
jgi:tRNA dimethylallyltransferase